jgi:hypothetical protein
MSTGEYNIDERMREYFEYYGTFGQFDHAVAGTISGIRRWRDS